MKKLLCATYEGLNAKVIDVELTLTKGLPSFSIVGMVSTAINEAKERCKSALLINEYKFPPKRITLNLSPSEIPKSGTQMDLSISLLILLYEYDLDLDDWFVFGELGLDGRVKENNQLYPLVLSLANQKLITKAIVPFESLDKLSKIPDIEFYGVKNLIDATQILKMPDEAKPNRSKSEIEFPHYEIDGTKYYYMKEYKLDFIDVKGQDVAKRAALISAAGFHNIIFEGSPGCGKSMIAQRVQYILAPMTSSEILDRAKLKALDGLEPSFEPRRSFCTSHSSATQASILGGGSYKAKIGEVGLSHNGILFFDELPHFSKSVLESLREPMQDGKIRISRVNSKVQYPASFLFIGAMNPCPCGNLLNENRECRCNELEISRYKNKLSEPFLDRIDLNVVMNSVSAEDSSSFSSKEMHKKVVEAHIFLKQRGQENFNAKMSDDEIGQYCSMNEEAKNILETAINRFSLSFRSIKKVQKVSRTIADLDSCEIIEKSHILEALSYRKR